ncbi:tautomerase family protein [Flexivirga oryzae]|uniref:4-oxalocrotonate tautomerase n=1 Tax=Flexivirga oryzae TaxID=1794944 RepID=A0A839N5C5_9MICO|nr:tautomerase family protein [Flexivirga oryzae]MBB2891959.1 4-oxalocrotonate tautomerase [Flexivirga oryzae]
MPIVDITLTEGRSPQQLRRMISALTEAVVTSVDAPASSVRVIVREIPRTHFAAGDQTIAERADSPAATIPDAETEGESR